MNERPNLEEIDAMCAAATEGPWTTSISDGQIMVQAPAHVAQSGFPVTVATVKIFPGSGANHLSDGKLIEDSRTLIPQLVARIRELESFGGCDLWD